MSESQATQELGRPPESPLEEWMAQYSVASVMPRLDDERDRHAKNEEFVRRRPEYGRRDEQGRLIALPRLIIAGMNLSYDAQKRAGGEVNDLQALDILEMKKAEETEWAKLFGQDELSPVNTAKALQAFIPWIDESEAWHIYPSSSRFYIAPHRMTPLITKSVAEAMAEDPAIEDSVMESYDAIQERAQAEDAQQLPGGHPYENMLEQTHLALSLVASNNRRSDFYYPDQRPVLELMQKLTERGIVRKGAWYRYGVGETTNLPSLAYAEKLSEVLSTYERDLGPRQGRHERYYEDACKLSVKLMESFAKDDRRNTHNAEQLLKLLAKTNLDARHPYSPADFINVSNAAVKIAMKDNQDVQLEPLDRSRPENMTLAMLRLAAITRNNVEDDETNDQLEYEETVYLGIIDFAISRAVSIHERKHLARALRKLPDYQALLPRTYSGHGAAKRRTHGTWNRWQPGYGKLT